VACISIVTHTSRGNTDSESFIVVVPFSKVGYVVFGKVNLWKQFASKVPKQFRGQGILNLTFLLCSEV
jgi:hypothetical protein